MTELRGGEALEFDGIHFTAIATPGHSPGSMMYLHGPLLFTGDSLMRKGDGLTTVGWLFSEDPARNRRRTPRASGTALRHHRRWTRRRRARCGPPAVTTARVALTPSPGPSGTSGGIALLKAVF